MNEELKKAIEYVREELGEDELAVVRAQANVCWINHMPIQTDYDDEIHDLLEEYGEDNELSEEWWAESTDLEEIISEL